MSRPVEIEAALLEVHDTLAALVVAADEQYAAVAERDRDRLETVTRRQEQLAARLERAERRRLDALAGTTLVQALSGLPVERVRRIAALRLAIARNVRELQQRNARAASLLEKSIELTSQSIQFLQRLAAPVQPTYGVRGATVPRSSVLVDSRA